MDLETGLGRYLIRIDPALLNLKAKIKGAKLRRLGMGESNLNYLAILNGKRFVVRINMDKNTPNKSRDEFNALKAIENLKIAPRAFLLDDSKEAVDVPFIVLEYMPGVQLDKHQKILDSKTVRNLARTVARLHSLPTTDLKLKMDTPTYGSLLKRIGKNIEYIKNKRAGYFGPKDEFRGLIDFSFKKVEKALESHKPRNECCIVHGDVCEQNILVNNYVPILIDWESVGFGDPAVEIARMFEAFGRIKFSEEQKRMFLNAYLKLRPDRTLRDRIRIFTPLIKYEQFTWAVMHVFEIKENGMHELFVKGKDIREDLKFAEETFNGCREIGIFDKGLEWSARMVFPEKYL